MILGVWWGIQVIHFDVSDARLPIPANGASLCSPDDGPAAESATALHGATASYRASRDDGPAGKPAGEPAVEFHDVESTGAGGGGSCGGSDGGSGGGSNGGSDGGGDGSYDDDGSGREFTHALQAGSLRATLWTLLQMPLNVSIVVRAS